MNIGVINGDFHTVFFFNPGVSHKKTEKEKDGCELNLVLHILHISLQLDRI